MNRYLAFAAVLGFTAVLMGAYLDHAVVLQLGDHAMKSLEKALHYHEMYAVLLTAFALIIRLVKRCHVMLIAVYFFMIGTLLFSGGIYATYLLGLPALAIVPFGGSLLMIGWLLLIIAAVFRNTQAQV